MTLPARVAKNPVFVAWLRLLRLPNLLTVPGDVLVGFVLAGSGPAMGSTGLAWAVAASLCLYAGGLLINDLVDREVDQHERPDRPLPAGLVSAHRQTTKPRFKSPVTKYTERGA